MSPVEPPDTEKPRKNQSGELIMQRMALIAVFVVAVIAVVTFSYVL